MSFSFDTITDRRGTDSLKYDFAVKRGLPADVLPLWVADMDFPAPPCVVEAVTERARHGIWGYSDTLEDYDVVLTEWFSSRFGWKIDPAWLVKTPGVVFAVATAVRAFTKPGDAVLIQPPVYYPFRSVVLDNGRKLVTNELLYADGRYEIDFADFEEKIVREDVKAFILCSPHNPVGRVWTEEELRRLGEICVRHGVLVIADEIHADFVREGHRHLPFITVDKAFEPHTVVCTAPSKTFNLAGLQISNILIPNEQLRRDFRRAIQRTGASEANVMGIVACRAAYRGGAEWLDALREYLEGNLAFVRDFLRDNLPEIRLVEPEGTYLIWLDCKQLALSDGELDRRIREDCGLWLDGGTMFGEGGSGFQRINIACPRATLAEAMEKLRKIR